MQPIAEEGDLLTKELNGLAADTTIQTLDKQEYPPSLAQQLDTSIPVPVKPSPVARSQAADKIHSLAAGGAGYEVLVAGDCIIKAKEGHEVIEYEVPFNLPSLTNSKGESALGIILNASHPDRSLLMRALKKKYPGFKAVHTHYIKSAKPLHGAPEPTSLQYMSMEALSAFTRSRDLGIDPADYWDVEHLRADVIHLITNKADNVDVRTGQPLSDHIKDGKGLGVRVSPLEFIKKRHQERMEAKALLDMNDGLGD